MNPFSSRLWIAVISCVTTSLASVGSFAAGMQPNTNQCLPLTPQSAEGVFAPLACMTPIKLDPKLVFFSQNRWWYIKMSPLGQGQDNVQTFVAVQNAKGEPVNGKRVDVSYRPKGSQGAWAPYGAQVSGKQYLIVDVRTGRKYWFQQDGVAPFNPFYLAKGDWEIRYAADGAAVTYRTITIK
ncbi:MAG: hypothetical protein U0573_14790 [Phycisphaerales bacterium]|nr:hypothetical protein [Planctomycetota bacterium]